MAPAEPVRAWLADETLLIADGHHRYATALAYRDERRAVDGPGPWDRILTLVVDAGSQDVPVLPYHRVQMRQGPRRPGANDAAESPGGPRGGRRRADALRHGLARSTASIVYRVHALAGEPPVVCALHGQLLDRIAPGDALRFTHDAADADEVVRDGQASVAYLLPATTPARIRAVVDRGDRLPRKSTFFWPKPRTGMLLMPLDPATTRRSTASRPAPSPAS